MKDSGRINNFSLPAPLVIAIGYLVLSGLLGLIWPFLNLGHSRPEFEAQDSAVKVGAYAKNIVLDLVYLELISQLVFVDVNCPYSPTTQGGSPWPNCCWMTNYGK